MLRRKDLLIFSFKYILALISFVKYGSSSENNQTIRISTIAPFFAENASNVTKLLPPAATQQTSDTFLIQDAMVPPNHKDVYVSPFSKPQFKEQLLPIIGAKVREQVEGFLEDVDDGIDFIKNIFTAKQNVVKNLAFKVKNRIPLVQPIIAPVDSRQKYHVPDFQPTIMTRIRINTKKPYYRYAKSGAISHVCDDPLKCDKKQEWPIYLNEIGTNGIKELEDSVLKKLEKIEEKKVEATLRSLALKRENDLVKGKPYEFQNDWKPVSKAVSYQNQYLDTKTAGSKIKINSQLNTSFKGTSAPLTIVSPSEPYPHDKKIYKNSRKAKASAKVKGNRTPSYGSIQEIIASTTDYHKEPLYDNHITHKKPETDFTPMVYQDDSSIDASSVKSVKKSEALPQKQRKSQLARTTSKSSTTTRDTRDNTRSSSFRWPKVSADSSASPSESKISKTVASTRHPVKRPLAERLVSSDSASDSVLPPPTKSSFVDKVRKTGYRGKVKFDSVLNKTV